MPRLLCAAGIGLVALCTACTADSTSEPDVSEPAASEQSPSDRDAFRPGEIWLDVDGEPINAHAGGVLHEGGTYYWYGQHMEGGTRAPEANRAWGGTRVDVIGRLRLLVARPAELEVRRDRAPRGEGRPLARPPHEQGGRAAEGGPQRGRPGST